MKHDDAANILSKIGNPTRLSIVRMLVRAGDEGMAVGVIQKELNIPGSTLTHPSYAGPHRIRTSSSRPEKPATCITRRSRTSFSRRWIGLRR